MQWCDDGLILGIRRHGESSVIVEMITPLRGRHLGIVRGGRSAKLRAVLQPGNSVHATWRARLEEHLGTFSIEPDRLRAAGLMENPLGIYGIQTLAGHLRLLPERDPHPALYHATLVVLDHLEEPQIAARLMVRFELALLEELGFGLDLKSCAATGSTRDLVYVSPKTGRAVSRAGGAKWADKLLVLPEFLKPGDASTIAGVPENDAASLRKQVTSGFNLTGFFLDRHIYGPRGIRPPDERSGFIKTIGKALGENTADQA